VRLSNDDSALIARIERRVAELLAQAATVCRAAAPARLRPVLRFDLRGQAAGQARWQNGRRPELRFNLALARRHAPAFVEDTVAHEVAHLVCFACFGRVRPHGPEWRHVMRRFGIAEPRRCHDYDLPADTARRQRRWFYECGCRLHPLSTTRHNRIQRGLARYHCRRCGEALRFALDLPDQAADPVAGEH
jgi:SprT protein